MIAFLFWFSVLFIAYTYAGYPLLLAFLAKLNPRRKTDWKDISPPGELPVVSLIIAAYNEQAYIKARLDNALQIHYPPGKLQIIVAADGSNDETVKIASKFGPPVEISFIPERRGKMSAVDRAIGMAHGEIIVLSDANNHYHQDCLMHLVKPFSDPKIGMVTGSKRIMAGDGLLGESEGLYWKYESFIKRCETKLGCTTGVAGEILAFRRSIYRPAPATIINDDFYLAVRAARDGYDVVYTQEAESFERISASAADEIARRARIIAGRFQAMTLAHSLLPWKRPLITWQIISHKFMRPLVPLAMIAAGFSNLLAVLWPVQSHNLPLYHLAPPYGVIFLVIQVVFYLAAWLGSRFELPGLAGRIFYIPVFLFNSNFATLIGLYRFLSRRQSSAWQRVNRREELSR